MLETNQAIGWIDEGVNTDGYGWTTEGKYIGDNIEGMDLVSEWVEPKRINGWINLHPSDTGMGVIANNVINPSKELADKFAMPDRVACIEIDVLEGEGLEVRA